MAKEIVTKTIVVPLFAHQRKHKLRLKTSPSVTKNKLKKLGAVEKPISAEVYGRKRHVLSDWSIEIPRAEVVKRKLMPGDRVRVTYTFAIPVPEKFWRVSKVRMYYASIDKQTPKTPIPFAEIRVYVYTQHPENYSESELDKILDRLEWIFKNIFFAKYHNSIRIEIIGLEREQVDEDEIDAPLDTIMREVKFFNKQGEVKHPIYTEDMIQRFEEERMEEYKKYKGTKTKKGIIRGGMP